MKIGKISPWNVRPTPPEEESHQQYSCITKFVTFPKEWPSNMQSAKSSTLWLFNIIAIVTDRKDMFVSYEGGILAAKDPRASIRCIFGATT